MTTSSSLREAAIGDDGAMLFNVAIRHGAPHLVIAASGRAHLCEFFGLFDLTARVAQMKGYKRVMIDLQAVEPAICFTEHLQLGAHAASALKGLERVATVVAPRFRTGSSEKSAQRNGLNLCTFVDLQSARDWLERS